MVKFRYKLNKDEKRINIFGELFVKNNKNNLTLIYKGKEYNLIEEFEIEDNNQESIIDIEIKGFNISSYLKYNCNTK